ncbi:MAG TPA: ABC transporter permease [Fibrobacteria bacterium]|nr:ABC transporter permease [Fibrobacteria bacterium]
MRQFLSSFLVGCVGGFREMRVQPLRSALSMIGVGLAIAAVTAILSINGGLQDYVHHAVSAMGGPGRFSVRTQSPANPEEAFADSRSFGMHTSDGPRLQNAHQGKLQAMNSVSKWADASSGGLTMTVFLNGVDQEYLENFLQPILQEGRVFSPLEYRRGDPVTILGWTLADRLTPQLASHGKPLIGSEILLDGVNYRIVGSFTMFRNAGWRYANSAVIPFHTMERFVVDPATTINNIQLQASDPDSIEQLMTSVNATMEWIHRGAQDFTFQIFNFIQEFSSMVNNITLLFSFVAVLSLGVGALGILNVMLASLADRVREVGVQKALGAKPMEIGIQFLAESITLSLVGGLAGMALGSFPVLLGDTLEAAFHFRPILDIGIAFQALGVTVVVGVIAGLFPAWKAMRLDPIEALRYE